MKSARTIECPKCGAPVDVLARKCPFCSVPLAPTEEAIQEDFATQRQQRAAFTEALTKMLEKGTPARDALHAASAAHLDAPLEDVVLDASLALARSFESSTKCSVMSDGTSLARLVEAYEKARREVLAGGAPEINLPFLAAGPAGPAHLNLELTRASMAALEASR